MPTAPLFYLPHEMLSHHAHEHILAISLLFFKRLVSFSFTCIQNPCIHPMIEKKYLCNGTIDEYTVKLTSETYVRTCFIGFRFTFNVILGRKCDY